MRCSWIQEVFDRARAAHPIEDGASIRTNTTVTFTYEIVASASQKPSPEEAWQSLRGIAKDIYASFGGGEAYLRQERANFYWPGQDPLTRRVMKRKP
jgi:hypothetical protein